MNSLDDNATKQYKITQSIRSTNSNGKSASLLLNQSSSSNSRHVNILLAQEIRTTKRLLLIVLMFCISWVNYFVQVV
jgi:hypothetical protein